MQLPAARVDALEATPARHPKVIRAPGATRGLLADTRARAQTIISLVDVSLTSG